MKKTWCVCERGGRPDYSGFFIDEFTEKEISKVENSGYGEGYRIVVYCETEEEAKDILNFYNNK